jgi:hypothetical protein
VLARSIDLQRRSLAYARTRLRPGAGSSLDVGAAAGAARHHAHQVDILRRQRALFEHAIATLVRHAGAAVLDRRRTRAR